MKKEKIAIKFKSQGKETTVYRIHPDKTVAELLVLILCDQHRQDGSYRAPDFYVNIPALSFWAFSLPKVSLLQGSSVDLSRTLAESKIADETYLEGIRHTEIGGEALLITECRPIYKIQPQLCHLLSRRRLLSYAVSVNNLSMTQALIEMGAHQDTPCPDEMLMRSPAHWDLRVLPALSLASYENNIDIVTTLIVHRANVNQIFNYLNPIGVASHSPKDTSESVFKLLAAGTRGRTRVAQGLECQVYQDSHLEVQKLVSYGGILPEEKKRDHVLNYNYERYDGVILSFMYYKYTRSFLSSDDDKTVIISEQNSESHEPQFARNLEKLFVNIPLRAKEWVLIADYYGSRRWMNEVVQEVHDKISFAISADDCDVGRYLSEFWKTSSLSLNKDVWAIISAYYDDKKCLIKFPKIAFLKPISDYLAEQKASPNQWLHRLKKAITANKFLFRPEHESLVSIAKVICLHVEWEVSRTGKSLSPDCFAALAKLAPEDWLQGAILTGRQQYRNYNPLPQCLLFTTNTKKQRVVELQDEKQITPGKG